MICVCLDLLFVFSLVRRLICRVVHAICTACIVHVFNIYHTFLLDLGLDAIASGKHAALHVVSTIMIMITVFPSAANIQSDFDQLQFPWELARSYSNHLSTLQLSQCPRKGRRS